LKLFFDENFDGEISRRLCRKFPGSIYAGDDNRFKGLKNGQLFSFLSGKAYVFVSEDKHFLKETVYPAENTGGIVVVRKKNMSPGAIYNRLNKLFTETPLRTFKGRLVVIRKNGMRVRIRQG
jgi:predicted nuclease of predicted toxin-antitoxin system